MCIQYVGLFSPLGEYHEYDGGGNILSTSGVVHYMGDTMVHVSSVLSRSEVVQQVGGISQFMCEDIMSTLGDVQ